MHMAAALGTPVVNLYALTNPQHTPWSVPHHVLYFDVPETIRSQSPLLVYTFSSVPESIQQQLSECIMTGLESDTAQAMGRQASAGLENVQGLESAQAVYRDTTERVREVLAAIGEG